MNYPTICIALAQQPGLGRDRIIKLNGIDSLVDPVGALLIYSGVHPLELQYFCNVSNEKLWSTFKDYFTFLEISIDDLGALFHLVDTELPASLDARTRRDRVINHLYRKYYFA